MHCPNKSYYQQTLKWSTTDWATREQLLKYNATPPSDRAGDQPVSTYTRGSWNLEHLQSVPMPKESFLSTPSEYVQPQQPCARSSVFKEIFLSYSSTVVDSFADRPWMVNYLQWHDTFVSWCLTENISSPEKPVLLSKMSYAQHRRG